MITNESIYTGFWKCRDLEIKMLWTRLALLGAIMALTYTGYGVLLMKFWELHKMPWYVFNLLAIVTCCSGMVFSCLWIATAKGSKRWYEQYEAAIGYFQEANRDSFERFDNGARVLSYLDFDSPELMSRRQPSDTSLWTTCGGSFSVSKIPVVLGQLSLVGWSVISILHLVAIFLGKHEVRQILDKNGFLLGVTLILGTMITVSIVCARIRSSFK